MAVIMAFDVGLTWNGRVVKGGVSVNEWMEMDASLPLLLAFKPALARYSR